MRFNYVLCCISSVTFAFYYKAQLVWNWSIFDWQIDWLLLLDYRYSILSNGTLVIGRVDDDDVGVYKCVGSGRAPPAQTYAAQLLLACKSLQLLSCVRASEGSTIMAQMCALWPWPWNSHHDLETRSWPRYYKDVPSHWKWSCKLKAFKTESLNWKNTRSKVKIKMSKNQNYFERYRNRYSVLFSSVQ